MILVTTREGAEVEAEIKFVDDGSPRFEVRIDGIGCTAPSLRPFSIVSATSEERIRFALGGNDPPEAQLKMRKQDPVS
ncbi:unnamed protein product, partial [marine sediment metagenome]